MSEQVEFIKTVKDTVSNAQARFVSLNGDARRRLNGLVEKGRSSQKDLSERLAKIAAGETFEKRVKPGIEELTRRVKDAGQKLDSTSRERAVYFAGELRRVADRIEKLVVKPQPTNGVPSADIH